MDKVSLVLAIGAALTFFGGTIQAIVAGIELKKHSVRSGQKKQWSAVILICIVLTVIFGGASYALLKSNSSSPTPSPVATSAPTVASASPTSSPPTPRSTPTVASASPTPSPIATSTPLSDYSAAQPGPSCDKNGGVWTTQGLNNIQCGTTISSDYNSLGYLYLQLPNNATFSSANTISVMGGNLDYDDGYVCLGLAEQGASSGILGEYCGNGGWFIYALSSAGVTTQLLNKSITSQRTTEDISLTLQGNVASFSIDTETYRATLPSIQPIKVAITSYNQSSNNYNTISMTNFSYTPHPE